MIAVDDEILHFVQNDNGAPVILSKTTGPDPWLATGSFTAFRLTNDGRYFPCQLAGRFSRKARTPSWKSSLR